MFFLLIFLLFPTNFCFFYKQPINNLSPLNLNKWYVIAESDKIKPNIPYQIKILNQDIVIWKNNNSFSALNNYCIHRGAPLSNGYIFNNSIICPYHNIGFNNNGKISSMPGNYNSKLPNICQKNILSWKNIIGYIFYLICPQMMKII